jgi:ABC-type multidrug transport system fused ATPase/permease subunit
MVLAPIPLIFKWVVDQGVPARDTRMLGWFGLLILVLLALHYYFSTTGARMIGQVIADRVMALRSEIFYRIQHLSFGYLDQQKTGRLVSKYAFDTKNVEGLALQIFNQFIPSIFYGTSVSAILIWLNWQLAVVLLLFIPIYGFTKAHFFKKLTDRHKVTRLAQEKLTGTASEFFNALRLVRSFGGEKRVEEAMESSSGSVARAYVEAVWVGSQFGTFIYISIQVLTAITIFGGSYLVMRDMITIGVLFAFMAGLPVLLQPLQIFTQMSDQYFLGAESYRSIRELIDSSFVEKWTGRRRLDPLCGELEFRDVSFTYPGTERHAVHGINLRIPPGEKLALVGASGAGKSTLVSLLLGLYEPTGGEIRVDGCPQQELDMRWFRRQTSIVMQESILLSGSLADNIRFGKPGASDDEVREAARMANAEGFIRKSKEGFATVVGERGAMLSGGQRQRIAIARAILRDPRILLLDEPTSALDYESERLIQEALDRLASRCTVITIAHRLSTIQNADRIVTLKDGAIVDIGNYASLSRRPGYFQDLLAAQQAPALTVDGAG